MSETRSEKVERLRRLVEARGEKPWSSPEVLETLVSRIEERIRHSREHPEDPWRLRPQ